jgi:hypothetical protein
VSGGQKLSNPIGQRSRKALGDERAMGEEENLSFRDVDRNSDGEARALSEHAGFTLDVPERYSAGAIGVIASCAIKDPVSHEGRGGT